MLQDVGGEHLADEEQEQPSDAAAGHFPGRGKQVGFFQGGGATQALDILRGLVFQHIHDVVNRDDTHQSLFRVHDGQRGEVIVTHQVGTFLLIGLHRRADEAASHESRHLVAGVGFDELEQADNPQQFATSVHDEVIEVLVFGIPLADGLQRALGPYMLSQRQVLGGHQAAGGLVGVEEQRADFITRIHQGQDFTGLFGR